MVVSYEAGSINIRLNFIMLEAALAQPLRHGE